MCGLYGWQFTNPIKRQKLAILAAVLSSENDHRGGHAWGYSTGETIIKGLGLMAHAVDPVLLAKHRFLMAHTRYATTGANLVDNAHPFLINGLVGAHNGIVYNHTALNQRYTRQCAVDSQHLFYHLSAQHRLSDIEAYGTITYHLARQPQRLYLGHFNGGELSVAHVLAHGHVVGLVYSSTASSLTSACNLAGLDTTPVTLTSSVLYVAEGGLLTPTVTPLSCARGHAPMTWDRSQTWALDRADDRGEGDDETGVDLFDCAWCGQIVPEEDLSETDFDAEDFLCWQCRMTLEDRHDRDRVLDRQTNT